MALMGLCVWGLQPGYAAAASQAERIHALQASFDERFAAFQVLTEESLVWRAKAIEFLGLLKTKLDSHEALGSDDLLSLHRQGTDAYKQMRSRLLANTQGLRWIGDSTVALSLTDNGTRIERKLSWRWPFYRLEIRLDPKDEQGRAGIKNIKMGLASGLLLYDNYILAISQYQRIGKLRRLANRGNVKTPNYLRAITANYRSADNVSRTARAARFIAAELAWEARRQSALDRENEYLNRLITGSYTYSKLSDMSLFDMLGGKLVYTTRCLRDTVLGITDAGTQEISMLFGNTVGLVATRSGKLKKLPAAQKAGISARLRPLDILLEKTPFRLTDRFIPGHWGHVAIWVGTEADLRELGVWDSLEEEHRQQIRSGCTIIEALRCGVRLNTLDHFLNIDDLATLRQRRLSRQRTKRYLQKAFAQVGKKYDFSFNVETDAKIVCSELAYVVYSKDIAWRTQTTLGRATISPDHVAMKAKTEADPFFPVLLYHDGRETRRADIRRNYNLLLNMAYDAITYER